MRHVVLPPIYTAVMRRLHAASIVFDISASQRNTKLPKQENPK
jgi:hypothetical protein